MKRTTLFTALALSVSCLICSAPVSAAPAETAKEAADYLMETNSLTGTPNWFHADFYAKGYADLQAAFADNSTQLYQHALNYGFEEARLVLPVLDVAKYKDAYPDLAAAFGDDYSAYIRHYFEYGITEGRQNFTDFDPALYLNLHADLKEAFGTDLVAAAKHYLIFGYAEGRTCTAPILSDSSETGSSLTANEPYCQ